MQRPSLALFHRSQLYLLAILCLLGLRILKTSPGLGQETVCQRACDLIVSCIWSADAPSLSFSSPAQPSVFPISVIATPFACCLNRKSELSMMLLFHSHLISNLYSENINYFLVDWKYEYEFLLSCNTGPFAMWLSCSSHQKMESISPPVISGLCLWLVLKTRM